MSYNAEVGIDFFEDNLTDNDPGDGDEGPNRLQNFPDLNAGIDGSGDLTVDYFVDSDPSNSTYPIRVEIFASDPGDGEETPEGQRLLAFDEFSDTEFGDGIDISLNLGSANALGVGLGAPTRCVRAPPRPTRAVAGARPW